ncbi:SagB/ThcOx family dehydrogenase [Aestuariivirga litoralis]|uniref:SagB/ThcOx family dehydrogenase n=1 Tax=Aestuariivirga litoralis TaxID=2650924 RepID=UPI0018C59D44|nr:SagB/ThcOx family dehydrogenase [Aestuariivirga litoralis]MBG1232670.1 SagB/ThcOx family dehydrogenase [Aestuariivirga litoralis]
MRVKSAATLVTFPQGEEAKIYNYLSKDVITCDAAAVNWLLAIQDWSTIDEIAARNIEFDAESIAGEIEQLVACGIFLEESSAAARREAEYTATWEFGPTAGIFHFGIMDNEFENVEFGVARQKERAKTNPSPKLIWRDDQPDVKLPLTSNEGVFSVMAQRRSRRNVTEQAISLRELGDCLYAGLGITGFIQTETAVLPLKMTPSGGARNPYEAYVWAQNVDGLARGIYHYSAADHALTRVNEVPNFPAQDLVQAQDWADPMPAIILLVAVLERTAWKYIEPNAYRVVLIEGGHIAQNMMLAATQNELTCCPTAALAHGRIADLLKLTALTHTPVYALTIGHPGPCLDTVYSVAEGVALSGISNIERGGNISRNNLR